MPSSGTRSQKGRLMISWSGLKRYEECQQRHKLTISGKSEVTDGRIFLPGTIADRIMRAWLESTDPQPGEMVKMVPKVFEKYAYDDPQYSIRWRSPDDPALVQNMIRRALKVLEPLLLEHVIPFGYAPELSFRVTIMIPWLDGRLVPIDLVGGIDIVVLRGTSYGIWDLKMTQSEDYWRKVLGQLIFYSIALSHLVGDAEQPRTAGLITPLLKSPKQVIDISQEQRDVMMQRIIRMATSMWQKRWEVREDNSICSRCDVKRSCPKFATPIHTNGAAKIASLSGAAATRRATAVGTT
jgi:hypothetical protein